MKKIFKKKFMRVLLFIAAVATITNIYGVDNTIEAFVTACDRVINGDEVGVPTLASGATYTTVKETVCAKADVNIRKGPGTSYAKYTVLKKGKTITRIGVGTNGWSKVSYNGQTAYISSAYLKLQGANTAVNETVKAVCDVNIRTGAGVKYKKLGILYKGQTLTRLEKCANGWSKVSYNGKTGYINSTYLSVVSGDNSSTQSNSNNVTTKTVYATANVNVRSGAGTKYSKLGVLSKGQSVERISNSNGWSKVYYNGKTAYVSSSYLSTTKPSTSTTKKPSSNNNSAPARSTPSSSIASKMASNSDLLGVLYVPSVGMDPVNVYVCHSGSDLQGIADARNSAYATAVYYKYNSSVKKIEIGDHVHHNFSVLKKISAGTIGYINMGNKVLKMKCVESVKYCTIPEYDKNMKNDGDTIITTACNGDGRTVNRWKVTSDSDVSFSEYYSMVAKYHQGQRNWQYE